ncbi:MAG: cytochrome c [Acidimicrobiia bacterium]|nr:cytochrome c [Acidimicrobiia bacterium]
MGLGAVVVGIAVLALLAWAAILINSGRARSSETEAAPQNLAPFLTDDELENARLSKVLLAALVSVAALALLLPIYYLGEAGRQAEATEQQLEADVEEGEHWFETFFCIQCHGAGGTGGGAASIEHRSGLDTIWAAPSLNDIFYRYDEDEVRFWIIFGRPGAPMPGNGLEGGGSMTSQQIDQLILYLRSIQIPQNEAFGQVETKVALALDRLDRADESVAQALADQEQTAADVRNIPSVFSRVEAVPAAITDLLSQPSTCTDDSAALVGRPCESDGSDSDRDGITDVAEAELTTILSRFAIDAEPAAFNMAIDPEAFAVTFDPTDSFSTRQPGAEPVDDLAALDTIFTDLQAEMINLKVAADNNEAFIASAEDGVAYFEAAVADRKYAIDMGALAAEAFDGDGEAARRAVGLFNAYCARCHTAGYSAGTAFEQEPGSGAWGPSLRGGKAVRQFPDFEDHVDLIIKGSERALFYGVNGLGNGWMPGFGFTLSREDIELIVRFERWL